MKKHEYLIILNCGKRRKDPLVYQYRNTKDIELHIQKGRACIAFCQGSERKTDVLLAGTDNLCTDAIKKAMLFHLILYAEPLDIRQMDMSINGILYSVCKRKKRDEPIVYSMIETRFDHPLPDIWRDAAVLQTLISMPKSAYDSRMNAVIALLLGKTRYYRSEKAIYLWMSMNGCYNFVTEQVKAYGECSAQKAKINNLEDERGKQNALKAIAGLSSGSRRLKEEEEKLFVKKAVTALNRVQVDPAALYDDLINGRTCTFADELNTLQEQQEAQIPLMTFMTIWLPYQIRCNYFHSDQAMPLFLYAGDPLLKALYYTNYFVERFVEENLPQWLKSKEIPEEQKKMWFERCKAKKVI